MIKVDEVVHLVVAHSSCVLTFKNASREVKDARARVVLFYLDAYGLNEMGLAHPCWAENEQGVKCLAIGVGSYSHANAHCKFVAIAVAIVLKGVARIELRVNVGILHRLKGVAWLARLRQVAVVDDRARVIVFLGHRLLVAHNIVVVVELDLTKNTHYHSFEQVEVP